MSDLFAPEHLETLASGPLTKMPAQLDSGRAVYQLQAGEQRVSVSELMGRTIALTFTGRIFCQYCGKQTPKSFQGFCYEHFMNLAQADSCIMSPEKCHFEQGTCREPEWGERHCFQTHYVYLANTGQVKVGITRSTQVPTRWIDQGAEQAIAAVRVRSRYLAGVVEALWRQHISDKTNWREMLRGEAQPLDLAGERDRLLKETGEALGDLQSQHGIQAVQPLPASSLYTVIYPVTDYPKKLSSINLDKQDRIQGRLMGVKGQYLILDSGVINIRRHTGYEVSLDAA